MNFFFKELGDIEFLGFFLSKVSFVRLYSKDI